MSKVDFQYYMPTRIMQGAGCLDRVGEEAKNLGKRALVVSYPDSPWVRQQYDRISDIARNSNVDVVGLGEIEPEPTPDMIDQVAKKHYQNKPDLIIGIGGGSVLDAAKGIATVLSLGGKTWDYVGRNKVLEPVLPIIAIPTTAGTGSEVTPYAIFKNKDIHRKAGIISPYIFPKVALLDAEQTVSLPARLTAISGIDAFAHALESYTSPTRNSMSDAISRKALELVGSSLETVISNGDDLAARSKMLLGSSLGGIAIAHAGTGIAHAIGATLGGFYPLEHGMLVGLVLPYAIRYNIPVAKERYAEVAKLIGLQVENLTEDDAAELLAKKVEHWLKISELPTRLRDLGVEKSDFTEMIEDTSTQNSVGNNIRPVDKNAIVSLYETLY